MPLAILGCDVNKCRMGRRSGTLLGGLEPYRPALKDLDYWIRTQYGKSLIVMDQWQAYSWRVLRAFPLSLPYSLPPPLSWISWCIRLTQYASHCRPTLYTLSLIQGVEELSSTTGKFGTKHISEKGRGKSYFSGGKFISVNKWPVINVHNAIEQLTFPEHYNRMHCFRINHLYCYS